MKFRHLITTFDYHHGQASRTITGGYPPILGSSMKEKSNYYDKNLTWIHKGLIREPRGHANMLGSIITEPVTADAAIGVLYLHADGQFEMCGDSAFATAFAVLENGIVKLVEPVTEFAMDTVAGLVRVKADVNDGVINKVTIVNVPAFYIDDYEIVLSNGVLVDIDVAYGGLYYAFIDCNSVGLSYSPENSKKIIQLGMEVIETAKKTLNIRNDSKDGDIKIDLTTFYEKQNHSKSDYRVCNVYPPGRMGRTPSGTGTSAHMAMRYYKGQLELNQDFIQESIIGTSFTGRLISEFSKENTLFVTPTISTKSYLMGINQFIIDADDPFKEGFMLNE